MRIDIISIVIASLIAFNISDKVLIEKGNDSRVLYNGTFIMLFIALAYIFSYAFPFFGIHLKVDIIVSIAVFLALVPHYFFVRRKVRLQAQSSPDDRQSAVPAAASEDALKKEIETLKDRVRELEGKTPNPPKP